MAALHIEKNFPFKTFLTYNEKFAEIFKCDCTI